MLQQPDMKAIERIELLARDKGIKLSGLERKLGMGNQTLVRIYQRKGGLRDDFIMRIKEIYPDINLVWVLTGEGSMYEAEDGKLTFSDDAEMAEHILDNLEIYSKKNHWKGILQVGINLNKAAELEERIMNLEEKLRIK